MRLHFLGANRQVTGSRYLLETGSKTVMIDCGLFHVFSDEDRKCYVEGLASVVKD